MDISKLYKLRLFLLVIIKEVPGAWMVFYEVPGGREVLTGEVSTHSRKCQLHVFLWDFAPGKRHINKHEHKEESHCK